MKSIASRSQYERYRTLAAKKMSDSFFPQRPAAQPMIYAYEDSNPRYEEMLKVGYTAIDVETRVVQQYPTLKPGERPYTIRFAESAVRSDGSSFMVGEHSA